MSAVFASLVWGSAWSRPGDEVDAHVQLLINNNSAVAWNNHRPSPVPQSAVPCLFDRPSCSGGGQFLGRRREQGVVITFGSSHIR
ncbi:hypothetical protein PF008_g2970 [Phytophthora fragariae]|uniref:Uncharacterized protein n=1 Tax=Phytophthora fragariae TaxID=53985 RepID=A0A6G0SFJ4_9STRA|nr:hypothetical protein PF008_g2970 [Phytophthora fragariae]